MAELTQSQKTQMEAILGSNEAFEAFLTDHREEEDSEAKKTFKMVKQLDPESLAVKLAHHLNNSHNLSYREECAELLHKLLTDEDGLGYNRLSVEAQSAIKSILLDRMKLEEEESRFIIQQLRSTVSKLAISILPDNEWPELFPFLYQCLSDSTSNNYLKQSVFWIFGELAIHIGETLVPCVKHLHSLFRKTLNNGSTLDLDLRVQATTAVFHFIIYVSVCSNEKERFQELLPGMMRTLTDALSDGDSAEHVLNLFIKLAKKDPKFLRMQLRDVVSSILEIAEDEKLEMETRHLAVEFVLTLVEAKEKAPGMMKKLPLFTHNFFGLLFNLLLDIKDEPSWHSAETEHVDAGETDNYRFGRRCLHRLSKAFGGKTITFIALEQLRDCLVSLEWEKRHATLIALLQIAEGSSKVMRKYLQQVVDMVLPFFQDPHPRVKWAAIGVIAQLSIDFCPVFQEQYHNQVLPALAEAMDDSENPRVQVNASVAVKYFCNSGKPETMVPYLDMIVNKLLVLLQNDNQMVHERALWALSSVIIFLREHFQKYYDIVMPYLNTILVNANSKSSHIIPRHALECASALCLTVDKEKFRNDLKQVLEVLILLKESQVKDLNTILHILKACYRICYSMGKDFLPYMSTVMPPLLECAQLELDKKVDESIHEVKIGDAIICIEGSDLLKEKSVACSLLGSFACTLKEDFYPWISKAASILVPLLKFSNKVGHSATHGMHSLLHSANLAAEKGAAQGGSMSYFKQLSSDIIIALRDVLYSVAFKTLEPKTKICACILSELNKCLKIIGSLLNEDQICSIIDELKHVIEESSSRKRELAEREKSEDFDAEEAELMRDEREQETTIFENVCDILLTLIRTFKATFLPFLDKLSSYLMPVRGEDKTAEEREKCILIFYVIVEHCGETAVKYCKIYLPFLLDSSNDEDPDVREKALYGLGLCAEYDGCSFKPYIEEALSKINAIITHCDALEPENVHAYDNAVSSLGKICRYHRDNIDSAQIIPAWLNCLPIRNDLFEAIVVHDQLCSLVERSDEELIGPNYEHFPKILSVFAEVLCAGEDLATKETTNRMKNLLSNLKETVPPATWESARPLLLPQQEMELESILEETETTKNEQERHNLKKIRELHDMHNILKKCLVDCSAILQIKWIIFVVTLFLIFCKFVVSIKSTFQE